jgi:hypothetical protein
MCDVSFFFLKDGKNFVRFLLDEEKRKIRDHRITRALHSPLWHTSQPHLQQEKPETKHPNPFAP